MYEIERYTDPQSVAKAALEPKPFGPGFRPSQFQDATTLLVQGTSANDPGPDFTLWTLLDSKDNILATARVDGY